MFEAFGVFISQVLQQNGLLLRGWRVQVLERAIVGPSQFLERSPDVGGKLAHENLSRVRLAPEVDLLGVDLVGDVDEQDVEEVVGAVVWLEQDLHFVGLVRADRALLRHEHKRHLLAVVLHAVDLGLQSEVDWERRDVLDVERLFRVFADDHVAERQNTVLWRYFHFWSDARALEHD